ncbi:MAG TPA: hypothetical protein VFV54_10265 [Thermoanaerobaculia bacterium]|nr:hypothetical protein [Thermoanaerobaculia bacterium]
MKTILALLFCCAIPAFAQFTGEGHELLLLPLATHETYGTPGGYGSSWVTHLSLFNATSRELASPGDIYLLGACAFPPCREVRIPAGSVQQASIFRTTPGDPPGALLWVREEIAADVVFSIRIQDLSRQALTWGTEIPVVRETELYRKAVYLHGIPLDPRFRQSLRVYDPLPHQGCRSVRIRFLDESNGAVLLDENALLIGRDCNQTPGSSFPHAVEWHGLSDKVGKTSGNLIVEVTPFHDDMAIWAFVTITNNETQHVTTITPQ